jgi:hypothetical protein
MSDDWQIEKPLGRCSATGDPIETGQEYYAALVETAEGLQRRDFSVDYWQRAKPQVYCYWKTRLPDAETGRRLFVDDRMLMVFFDRLAAEVEPEKINFRFVLALVLMRRKRLKYESSFVRDAVQVWRLRITGTAETVEVVDPGLGEEEIERLSSQIGQILQVEL